MTVLNDSEIWRRIEIGDIVIDPTPEDGCFQPASVDLTMGRTICWYISDVVGQDIEPETTSGVLAPHGFFLEPGQFILGVTRERVKVPSDLVARVEGKSSLGRMGLLVHVTAGYIDPGFDGNITLELCNLNSRAKIQLTPGMKISQLAFETLTGPADRPYGSEGLGSRYQGDQVAKAYRVAK